MLRRAMVALVLSAMPVVMSAQASSPLAAVSGQRVLVLPTQRLTFADSLGWAKQAPSSRAAYLTVVDSALTDALAARGLRGTWTFAEQVVRSARRNAGFVADPSALAVESLRTGTKPDLWQLREPLATQLRSLIALTDARYVLLPVELRTVGGDGRGSAAGAGAGRAQLKLVLIDARRSQIRWMGTVSSELVTAFSPAVAAGVASRVADLVVAR